MYMCVCDCLTLSLTFDVNVRVSVYMYVHICALVCEWESVTEVHFVSLCHIVNQHNTLCHISNYREIPTI